MKVTLLTKTSMTPRLTTMDTLIEEMQSPQRAQQMETFQRKQRDQVIGDIFPEEKNLPVAIFSSLYKRQQEQIRWVGYTGLVLTVIKGLAGEEKVREIKRKAADCLFTFAAFSGTDGETVNLLTRFCYPDGLLPKSLEEAERFHAHACRKAAECYHLLLKVQTECSQSAIGARCRLSYDPEVYYHPQALPIAMEQPLRMPSDDTEFAPVSPTTNQGNQWLFQFDIALRETLREKGDDRDSEEFLICLAEKCFESGVPEEEAVKRIRLYSQLGVYENRVRAVIRNVYLMGKGFGSRSAIPPVQRLAMQMEEFISRRYDLRRNTLKKNVEYRERAALFARFRPVNEEALNTISLQAHSEGLDFWDRDVKRYIYSNRVASYNPVQDYLDRLPPWNGKDHIGRLAATLPTNHPHWTLCFRRWFLGMVAQWKGMNPRHGNCLVPLLSGKQSTGKSSWCKQILPPELRDYYTESVDMTARRNAELALNRFALINLDEFDAIPESKQPLLKHLLQLPEVTLKRPHSSLTETLPRYASFIATCNPMEVLTDPTGSRRFLCVEVTGPITPDPFTDYAQLYAQAIAALRAGERYWLDREEEADMTRYNDHFSLMCPEEQLLLDHFRPTCLPEEKGQWLSAMQILLELQKAGRIRASRTTMRSFAGILRKHHFIRKHTSRGNLYEVIPLKEIPTPPGNK